MSRERRGQGRRAWPGRSPRSWGTRCSRRTRSRRRCTTRSAPRRPAWPRRLGGASMELLWALAARAPAVVIEANFRPYSEFERGRLLGLGGLPVEVHCACPPEIASARYNARLTHPVHVVKALPVAAMAEYDRPVGIGALVTVDTTRPVDVAAVAGRVR